MATVRATAQLPGSVHDAERCWYETSRWPVWVDQLARVVSVEANWPGVGATVTWDSGPAGRGRVRERVTWYEPRAGQAVEVEDDSITGQQTVTFTAGSEGVTVEVALAYRIKRRNPLTPVVDLLFIRRLMAGSLRSTLGRFGTELETFRGSA